MKKYILVAPGWMSIKRPSMSVFGSARAASWRSSAGCSEHSRKILSGCGVPSRTQSTATDHGIDRRVLDAGVERVGWRKVLQEFYVNVTRKISTPLPKPSARAVVDTYTIWCVDTKADVISTAFRIEDEARIGFWDALIVAYLRLKSQPNAAASPQP